MARVLTTYQKGDGTEIKTYDQILPLTRKTIDIKGITGLGAAEFSTLVEADTGLVADRTMTLGPGRVRQPRGARHRHAQRRRRGTSPRARRSGRSTSST